MANDQERAAFEAALSQLSDGTYLMPGWDVRRARSALAAAPVQAVPKEPLFLLHTGGLYGNERDAWEVQANSQAAVDELCNAQPLGAVLHLYALTPAAPQVPAVQVGHVYRYGSDSKGLAWHGIYWNHAGVDLPDGTPLYAGAPPSSPSAAQQPAERVPLTVPEILELMPDEVSASYDGQLIEFARAIEQAHGIRAAGVKEPT